MVTNSSGCQSAPSASSTVIVNALPARPIIIAEGPTTFCGGGSVTLTSSPGSTYLWSNGATTSSINVTSSGNYSVRVTNISGCISTSSIATIVTVNPLPATPSVSAGSLTTFCEGGSVKLTSTPGNTYLWSTGATTSSINVNTTGSYYVIITDANGCQSASSASSPVTVNALPATPTITTSGPTTFCAGSSVTLTSSAGKGYLWSDAAGTPGISVTTGGNYSVQVTDANGCQSTSSVPITITVNSLPVTPTITAGGPTAFCAGGNVTFTSSAGTGYTWSNAADTPEIIVTTGGSYSVQVTDANGCHSAPSVATVVTVNDLPTTPVISADGPTTFCEGGSVALTSDEGTSYLWSTGAITPEIIVTTGGNYSVQVTNENGCLSSFSLPADSNSKELNSARYYKQQWFNVHR